MENDSEFSSQNGANGQVVFADAVARARQIAAKMSSSPSSMPTNTDSSTDGIPALNTDAPTQFHSVSDQQRPGAVAAAAAAAQINAKLGIMSNSTNSMPQFGVPRTETITVPDKMVGLLIGRGGEQIAAIQAETDCRIQFAQDSGGMPERVCTLTGTSQAISKAKEMISRIVNKGRTLPDCGDNAMTIECMIPGYKVGLVIGKGGETIKQLQEKLGVKIVVIQDSNLPTQTDKPLRITGDRFSCQRAKDMITELLADKDMQPPGFTMYGSNMAGPSSMKQVVDIPVPRSAIGVVIGKGGETIKKIQEQTGARVQFKPEDEMGGMNRLCSVSGTHESTQAAVNIIRELIDNAARPVASSDMMRMVGRGRGDWNNQFGGDWGPNVGRDPFRNGSNDITTFAVPADKCGLVIGKGGETIREINRVSGAKVELSRDPQPNPQEKIFKIQGSPDQVQHAIRLVSEKAGMQGMSQDGFMGPPQSAGFGGQFGGSQPVQVMSQQSFAPAQNPGWGTFPQQPQQSQFNPTDANKPSSEGWMNYYAQMYTQQQQPQQQQQQQPPPQQQPQQQQFNPQLQQRQVPGQPQPTINPSTGQPDYSAAWADYYRQQGMHAYADAILQAAYQQRQTPQ